MGRLSKKKIEQIKAEYEKDPNAKSVGKQLNVDPRTVTKHAVEQAQPISKSLESTSEIPDSRKQKKAFSRFLQLKKRCISDVDIAIKLDLDGTTMANFNLEFYRLVGADELEKTYRDFSDMGLESVSKILNMIRERDMDLVEFADKLKTVQTLINYDKECNRIEQQITDGRSKLENIMDQIKSTVESHQKFEPAWDEEMRRTIQDKSDELFQDPSELPSMLAEAAVTVLADPAKYETVDAHLMIRSYSERETENFTKILSEIVAQFNAACIKRLYEHARQVMQRFNDQFFAHIGSGQPSLPAAEA